MPCKRIWLLCGLAILLAGVVASCSRTEPAAPTSSIAPADLYQRLQAGKAPVILDVRSPQEFAAGHIVGAINIPDTEVQQHLPELNKYRDQEIVVHCAGGKRAARAEKVLVGAGFSHVLDLQGHMNGWKAKGLPTEPSP